MSVDTYAPSSALSFLDMDDNELLPGADTQPTQYDYRDFTMPSTSQSQTQNDQLEIAVSCPPNHSAKPKWHIPFLIYSNAALPETRIHDWPASPTIWPICSSKRRTTSLAARM